MSDGILPLELRHKLWSFADVVRVALPSERLQAFKICAQRWAGFVGPLVSRADVVDRLLEVALANDVVSAHGNDAVQTALAEAFEHPIPPEEDDFEDDGPRPPELSDDAIALIFADEHGQSLRYVAAWGRWLQWTGAQWRNDETLLVLNLVRRVCRRLASECDKEKVAKAVASAKTVAAVVSLARADRKIAATVDQWDADPWLLNTPGGVVDLRSGLLRPHATVDYLTKITVVAPNRSCPIPLWLQLVRKASGDDEELVSFLKRMLGYALTGLIRENALFFVYGKGANGKSTFLNAIIGCLGDGYHHAAGIETFTASTSDRHPTELASLVGARLVTAVETEEGRRWAESKIKSLTGGDKISARFMRQDPFDFSPVFKLLIAGNHMPSLRSVDEAIRRRFHLIPFTVTVPPEERDEKLSEKLRAEWPGILAWMIDGCLEWQVRGLNPPPAVKAATASYLEAEDATGAWIEQAGECDPNAFETTPALFENWRKYAAKTGEWIGSLRKFSQRLDERGDAFGLRKGRDSEGRRGFYGLRLPALAPSGADDVVP